MCSEVSSKLPIYCIIFKSGYFEVISDTNFGKYRQIDRQTNFFFLLLVYIDRYATPLSDVQFSRSDLLILRYMSFLYRNISLSKCFILVQIEHNEQFPLTSFVLSSIFPINHCKTMFKIFKTLDLSIQTAKLVTYKSVFLENHLGS